MDIQIKKLLDDKLKMENEIKTYIEEKLTKYIKDYSDYTIVDLDVYLTKPIENESYVNININSSIKYKEN